MPPAVPPAEPHPSQIAPAHVLAAVRIFTFVEVNDVQAMGAAKLDRLPRRDVEHPPPRRNSAVPHRHDHGPQQRACRRCPPSPMTAAVRPDASTRPSEESNRSVGRGRGATSVQATRHRPTRSPGQRESAAPGTEAPQWARRQRPGAPRRPARRHHGHFPHRCPGGWADLDALTDGEVTTECPFITAPQEFGALLQYATTRFLDASISAIQYAWLALGRSSFR
jgi:hypothetical protein